MGAFVGPVRWVAPRYHETPPTDRESPEHYVRRLALEKAREVAGRTPDALVLAADTVVVIDGNTLGKPADDTAAGVMLRRLRGRAHHVLTGLAAVDSASGAWQDSVKSTLVSMRRLSEEEIERYVSSGEPLDKAGGYAVQDPSFRPASGVEGCYLNVVGLPLCEVVTLLERMGADTPLQPCWAPPAECRGCTLAPLWEATAL